MQKSCTLSLKVEFYAPLFVAKYRQCLEDFLGAAGCAAVTGASRSDVSLDGKSFRHTVFSYHYWSRAGFVVPWCKLDDSILKYPDIEGSEGNRRPRYLANW